MTTYRFAAPCLMGLEKLLSNELKYMGALNVLADNGRVFFNGDLRMLARANIRCRFAERILIVLDEFEALEFEDLFQAVKKIPWENFIPKNGQFPVKGSCLSSKLRSVPACQSIIKKAVSERLSNVYKKQWHEESGALYSIRFLGIKDKFCIMLDTSGEPLHKRGYRANANDAPIRETLAAALAELSRVRSDYTVIDPCCGSGTILIEAAMKALNIPANAARSFICEDWELIPKDIFKKERELARSEIKKDARFIGYGYDIDENALKAAFDNASKAGVADRIIFKKRDIADFYEDHERASVICNPPYGERLLDINEAESIYTVMGQKFLPKSGWSYTIISPDDDFERCFGRKADKRRKLYNGMISCQVYQYFKSVK